MRTTPTPDRQAGFTLIEILIAVIVLSIGLLGVATLQLTSKRGNFEAMQRASATMYAEDLVERMRANPGALGEYISSASVSFDPGSPPTSQGYTDPDCSSNCTGVQLANDDVVNWWDQVVGQSEVGGTGGLVEPTGCLINPPDDPATDIREDNEYLVAIAWRGMDPIDDPDPGTATPAAQARSCGFGQYTENGESHRRVITVHTFIDPQAG